jgi:hypothetical protein
MDLDTENKMMDFVRTLKYLVVFPDKKTQIYRSLRDISEDICVDYSTISKKLKNEFQKALILFSGFRRSSCPLSHLIFFLEISRSPTIPASF